MEYNREEIAAYLKRKERYIPENQLEAKIDREIALRKKEATEYNVLLVLNLALLVALLGFGTAAIVNIFKGNWPYCVGFGVLAYLSLFIFRRVPYPQTRMEKATANLQQMLRRYR